MTTSDRRGVWPPDEAAASALREWLTGDIEEDFYGLDLDFSRSGLSGGDLLESWLSDSRFTDAFLRNATLVRAHLEQTDFTGADLGGANLAKAQGGDAVFRNARLLGANFTASQFRDVDFTGADLTDVTADKVALREAISTPQKSPASAERSSARSR